MTPLHVVAYLAGPVMFHRPVALDGLLAWAVATMARLPPASIALQQIEIPVAREPGGRFHLCSHSVGEAVAHERHWLNRRFPIAEAQMMGDRNLRRVQLSSGPGKSYRIPMSKKWLKDDRLDWWLVGDAEMVRELLGLVGYLGKKRSVGLGKVQRWEVEPCEPWGDGFPVVRDGEPLRTLPPDWPGITGGDRRLAVLTYPYWMHELEQECIVP